MTRKHDRQTISKVNTDMYTHTSLDVSLQIPYVIIGPMLILKKDFYIDKNQSMSEPFSEWNLHSITRDGKAALFKS